MTFRLSLVLGALVAGSVEAQMLSDMTPPQHRVVQRHLAGIRVNGLGLSYEGRVVYRYRLYASQSPTFRDNFLGLGATLGLSPIYARVGPYVEFQPASFFGVYAAYEFKSYFGVINNAQSFASPADNFSDSELARLGGLPKTDPARAYSTIGSMLTVGANVNLRFGPLVVRDQARLIRPDFKVRAGDTTIYDQLTDVLLPNHGFTFLNDLDVLFMSSFGLSAGVRYSLAAPFYSAAQAPLADNSFHRVGPVVAYRFKDSDGAAFNQPTVFLMVNWWLKHRWRTGADTSQAIPYLALGFSFVGDLLPFKPAASSSAPAASGAPPGPNPASGAERPAGQ